MFVQNQIERAIDRFRSSGSIPLRLELWDGRRFDFAPAPATYLAGCAHGFAHGWIDIHQILACKTVDGEAGALPWTRDYMYEGRFANGGAR